MNRITLQALAAFPAGFQHWAPPSWRGEPSEPLTAIEQKTLAPIEGLAPGQFDRTAVFEGYGVLTLRGLVHRLCSHDQQHLAGLQCPLGKADVSRVDAA